VTRVHTRPIPSTTQASHADAPRGAGASPADDRYYLVPRRLVHAVLATLVLLTAIVGASGFVLAERWLPEVERLLDAEAPLASPDVVVLWSNSRSRAADRAAAELLKDGGAAAVVLASRPFAPDELAPAERSRRYGNLTALGVTPERIVELYRGTDLWEALDDLSATTTERGWRRVLFLQSPGEARRTLLAARRILGGQGVEVGLQLYARDDAEEEPLWWTDGQLRSGVLYNWVLLVFGRLVGRY
jgi:uncharacterized SAM-binding protein YcdF (DUF218 family)